MTTTTTMITALLPGAAWLIDQRVASWFLALWIVVVLVYGLTRSVGEAAQDPIRPSGPFPGE